jgi:hypothetical protein
VIATLGSAPRQSRRKSNAQARPEPEAALVETGKATIVAVGSPFPGEDHARVWLSDAGEAELAEDLVVLQRALHAYRLASADPYLHSPGRGDALVARIGFGLGEEVADGRWTDARELRPAAGKRGRAARLEPQARFAAILSGRDRALACEELALRARLDFDEDRPREATLLVLVALDAALSELAADPAAAIMHERLEELGARRSATEKAARSALEGSLGDDALANVAFTLMRIEAALRARSVARGS